MAAIAILFLFQHGQSDSERFVLRTFIILFFQGLPEEKRKNMFFHDKDQRLILCKLCTRQKRR